MSKFEKMSDREILISVCSKVDNFINQFEREVGRIEGRVDNHSAERDEEVRQNNKKHETTAQSIDVVNKEAKELSDRVFVLETEKRIWVKVLMAFGATGGIAGWWHAVQTWLSGGKHP